MAAGEHVVDFAHVGLDPVVGYDQSEDTRGWLAAISLDFAT